MMRHWKKRLKSPLNYLRYRREYRGDVSREDVRDETVSMVMVTHNRRQFLSWTLGSLFAATEHAPENWELVIWDNASEDGTEELLAKAEERPNVTVIRSEENVGVNGYYHGFEAATFGDYLVELDDDVLWFPEGWLETMLLAFARLPKMGFLSADMIRDEYAGLAAPDRNDRFYYQTVKFDDEIEIAFGPASGHCAMTTRAIYEEVGKFPVDEDRFFFSDDGHYNRMMRKYGYHRGILKSLKVYHAAGPHCNFSYMDIYKKKIEDFFLIEYEGEEIEVKTDFLEHFQKTYEAVEFEQEK